LRQVQYTILCHFGAVLDLCHKRSDHIGGAV
jgi:hypothetical protein